MRIYFIRHGESQVNVERIFSYKIVDLPLTEKGCQQARYLAEWLADRQITRVYSSPLRRAEETARILVERVGLADLVILEGLREINVGALDGKRDEESWAIHNSVMRRWFTGEPEFSFEDGESYVTVSARMRQTLEHILSENTQLAAEQSIAVVGHGGIFTFGLSKLCANIDMAQCRKGLHNTAVVVVEVNKGQLDCLGWGMVEHLPQEDF
jgi:broad specificity phosphatase PhoE